MEERLIKRGETSGRVDDNAETIKKRFRTFMEKTVPVLEKYEQQNKVKRVCLVARDSNICQQCGERRKKNLSLALLLLVKTTTKFFNLIITCRFERQGNSLHFKLALCIFNLSVIRPVLCAIIFNSQIAVH